MILNQAQAEAVYSAMCALNNVGATASSIDAENFDVTVRNGVISIRSSSDDFKIPVMREAFTSQAAFAAAYGLN
jgi:hypothetical protein